jgi:hypothetical protein
MSREARSVVLLISIVLFFVLAPILESAEIGGLFLLLNLYVTLVAATIELAEKRKLFWSAIPLAGTSMILLLVSRYHPIWPLLFANNLVLAAFLLLVSVSLFNYLGQKGQIARVRLYVSVSLYFLLGLTWFAFYNLLNVIQPGSFSEGGVILTGNTHWSTMLYFSLTTLTTLGYGDILAVKPAARMISVLEAVAGVLYIAITVARLIASQSTADEHEH